MIRRPTVLSRLTAVSIAAVLTLSLVAVVSTSGADDSGGETGKKKPCTNKRLSNNQTCTSARPCSYDTECLDSVENWTIAKCTGDGAVQGDNCVEQGSSNCAARYFCYIDILGGTYECVQSPLPYAFVSTTLPAFGGDCVVP